MLLDRIELSTSPLPKHSPCVRLLKTLAFSLRESRVVAFCSRINGASGPGNSGPTRIRGLAGPLRHQVACEQP
jgi:hypothetical protein